MLNHFFDISTGYKFSKLHWGSVPSIPVAVLACSDKEASLSSSNDDNVSDGCHEEATVTIQKIGKFNFPPLNPEKQSRGNPNNNAKLAAAPSFRKALKKAPGRIRPKAILLGAASATQASSTPKEIVVLEVEDMPIELEDNIYHIIWLPCYDIIPKIRYTSHKNSKSCHSPARPPEDTLDKFSCETCHRSFKSKESNDLHEPCKAASNYIPTRKSKRVHNTRSVVAAKVRQRDIRLSMMATDRIAAIYRVAMRKPNIDGTYNVNGQDMSMQDLKKTNLELVTISQN